MIMNSMTRKPQAVLHSYMLSWLPANRQCRFRNDCRTRKWEDQIY